jgi:signal peptidase I
MMNFDFPTIMVIAVFGTGLIWALDALVWAPKRREQLASLSSATAGGGAHVSQQLEHEQERAAREPIIVEYSRSLFPVILIVLILRSFMVEPFRIPSGSMMPTLLVGDFILVNKYAYGIRLPVINTKIIDVGEPKRGDVVVFRYPKDPSTDYIKRVIGLPGDRIAYYNKKVFVNGVELKQEELSLYQGVGSGIGMSGSHVKEEDISDKVHHKILIDDDRPTLNGDFVVPENHYFVMGDNRDNSNDSRYWGFVPEENLVGKAFMIWMNWDTANNGVSWSRIGDSIN